MHLVAEPPGYLELSQLAHQLAALLLELFGPRRQRGGEGEAAPCRKSCLRRQGTCRTYSISPLGIVDGKCVLYLAN